MATRLRYSSVFATCYLLSALADPGPTAPSYGSTFSFEYDLWDLAEDLVTHYTQAQDAITNKSIFSGSSPVGSYTELVRGDLGLAYIFYPTNGSFWCQAFSNPTFVANPFSFAGLPFIGTSLVRGARSNHFRVSSGAGSFITGAYTSIADGSPLVLTQPSQQLTWEFTKFDNTSSPAASLFDVPSYCT
jgi:hypothetical protein